MSKYKAYGTMLDDLARKRISDYEKAKQQYEKAKRDLESIPVKFRIDAIRDAEYSINRKEKELALIKAEKNFEEAQKVYKGTLSEAEELRTALYNEIQEDLAVNPEDLDKNTVDLLVSGVCTAQEVADLYKKAKSVTTKRYVAKYAHDKVNDNPNIDGASILHEVVFSGRALKNPDNSEAIQKFDSVLGVLKRCVNNPGMVGYWGQLTEGTISEM